MEFGNLRNWFGGSVRDRELAETRARFAETEAVFRASPPGKLKDPINVLTVDMVLESCKRFERVPSVPILMAMAEATDPILRAEAIGIVEPLWPLIESDPEVPINFRQVLAHRRRFLSDFTNMHGIVTRRLQVAYDALVEALPESCFGEWAAGAGSFEVPLIELIENPADLIQRLFLFPYDDDTMRLGLFEPLRVRYVMNWLVASGLPPDANAQENAHRLILPTAAKNKTPRELVDMYLGQTPFADLLDVRGRGRRTP